MITVKTKNGFEVLLPDKGFQGEFRGADENNKKGEKMALETLKKIERIDGFDVQHFGLPEGNRETKQDDFILINHKRNTIEFKIQNGAIQENGVNGCQVDTLIKTTETIINQLNYNFPCKQNKIAIIHLQEAYNLMKDRKKERENRGVEGKEEA